MPAVRLPQSLQEIHAAAKIIADAAYPDLKVSPSPALAKAYEEDRKLVAGWLATLAPLGAITHVDLVTQADLCLAKSHEQLQSLRPGRVASLLARRSWVGAKAA
jgi:hypothetical protein